MYVSATGSIGSYISILPTLDGGAEDLLLDLYPGSYMAFSLRKISKNYSGPAISVYNGSTSADIGFDNGLLDTAALAAHCGSNDGLIDVWYDQSGNGNDMIQLGTPIRNPRIYIGSTAQVESEGGKPIVRAIPNANLDALNSYVGASEATIFSAVAPGSGSFGEVLVGDTTVAYNLATQNNSASPHRASGSPTYRINNADVVPAGSNILRSDMFNQTRDQNLLTTHFDSSGYGNLTMGYDPGPQTFSMFSTQEFIMFHSDMTSDESDIETEMNSFYNIYGTSDSELPVHVFLLAGQSNMVGRPTFDGGAGYPADTLQYTKSTGFDSSYSDTTLIDAASPLGHWDATAGDMGLAIDFVTDYVAANNVQAVLIPAADGGTGFANNQWNPGDAQYEHAVDATNALMAANPTWEFQAVLWHQGESDQANANFAEDFYGMIQSMRNDITVATQETPFILGEILAGGNATTALNTGVLADTTTYNYNTALVSSAGLTSFDNLHFDAASLRTFGSRYHTALAGLNNPYPTAEVGATGHWLTGTSNQMYIDLTGSAANMSEVGSGHTQSINSVTTQGITGGTFNAIDTGIAPTANVTMCTVFEYLSTGSLDIIMGNLGIQSVTGGFAFFRNGAGDIRFNERGGVGVKTLRTASNFTVGNSYFLACSLDTNDNYVLMIADTSGASTSFSISGQGGGRFLGTGRNYAIGCLHYSDATFTGSTTVSEVITFDTAKTLSELEAIAGRSRTRLATRGITVQ